MGSWSESCGFSGLEIGEGEVAYVLLMDNKRGSLNDGAFIHYAPTTTLLRGRYNDYGYLNVEDDQAVLDVFNAQSGLTLANGVDFSIDHIAGRTERRWWIHGSMFDFLPSLKPEFPYSYDREANKSIKIKDIGGATDRRLAAIRASHDAGRASYAERMAIYKDHERSAELIEALGVLDKHSLRDIFGYSDAGGYYERFGQALQDNVENIDGLIEAHRRTFVLGYAMVELRKTLAPNESCGPQHGGEIALDQFAVALRRIIRERKKRWDD